MQRIYQHGVRRFFVIFNRNYTMPGTQGMFHYQQAVNDTARMFLHQHGITGNVRFALGAVKYQGINDMVGPRIEFDKRREAGPAQPHNPRFPDYITQGTGIHILIISEGMEFCPFIFTVRLNDDTGGRQARGMRNSKFFDRNHRAGGRGVHGDTNIFTGFSNHLTFQYPLSDLHDGFCRFTDMLLQWQGDLRGWREWYNVLRHGHMFMATEM